MENNYTLTKKTGNEEFTSRNTPLGFTVKEFWSWAFSDLLNNVYRGKLAEFIVARALGLSDEMSSTWDKYDLKFMGKGIEVKSSAYVQSWHQEKLSAIYFGTRKTLGLNETTNKYDAEQKRQADIYVFCLLKHKDKDSINPLDFTQWEFYIVPTLFLDEYAVNDNGEKSKESIPLHFLHDYEISSCTYEEICPHVKQVIEEINNPQFKIDTTKVYNFQKMVAVYKEGWNGIKQTAVHTNTNKTELKKKYRNEKLIPVAVLSYREYLDSISGNCEKLAQEIKALDKDFIIREVGKHFN